MAYSESLAERIRHVLRRRADFKEKKMFGGVGYLMNGNMLVGIWQQSLILRLGAEQSGQALQCPSSMSSTLPESQSRAG